jgi:hypothetical protein
MSRAASSSAEFYTLEAGPSGGFVVRGWDDQRIVSLREKQRDAIAAAKRLNLEGHATSPVELPEPVVYGATQRAEKDGVSVADWISSAVEERIRNDELSDRVWRRHAEGAPPKALRQVLDLIGGDNPPDPGDEL